MNPYLTGAGRALLLAAVAFLATGAIAGSWLILALGEALTALLVLAFYAMLPSTLVLERRLLQVELRPGGDTIDEDAAATRPLLTGRRVDFRVRVNNRAGAQVEGVRLIPHLGSGLRLVDDVPANLRVPGWGQIESTLALLGVETGRWAIHGFEVRIRDRFGLFEVGEYVACPTLVKLLPDAVLAASNDRPPALRAMAQQRAGLHFVVRKGFGMELRELRNHQHGDPFRAIAWKATARTGRLMVKEYESELVLSAYVCLDVSSTMRGSWAHDERRAPSRLEHALRLTFAFADMMIRNNDRVGLTTFDEKLYGHLRVGEGRAHLSHILQHLVGLRHIVDEDLTEHAEPEVIDALVRYLLVQERLDFRRNTPLRPVKGIGQGMDYWSFSREIADRDESLYDLELLDQWLRLALPEEERRFDDPCLRLGVLDAPHLSRARRFCQLRGVEIPYRVEARLGQKERGLVQAIETMITQARDAHFMLIVSDLCGIMNIEPVLRALRLGMTRQHRFAIVSPFVPDYVHRDRIDPRLHVLHDTFRLAEDEERRTLAREVEKIGVPVIPIGPDDTLHSILGRMGRRFR